MTTFDGGGQPRERQLSMASKIYDGGRTEKRVYRFLSPADVQGTGILVFDYADKPDDVWIYLPALRKTRRIVSSQRAQSFMGSEFSYGDLNIPALDDYSYAIAKEEPFAGEPCWVIDVVPKTKEIAEADGYSKKTYWVSRDKFAVVRGLFYDKDGKLLKELLARDIKLLDPKNKRYRPMHMEMINRQNGRRSLFESTKATFAPNTKDEYSTTTTLEAQPCSCVADHPRLAMGAKESGSAGVAADGAAVGQRSAEPRTAHAGVVDDGVHDHARSTLGVHARTGASRAAIGVGHAGRREDRIAPDQPPRELTLRGPFSSAAFTPEGSFTRKAVGRRRSRWAFFHDEGCALVRRPRRAGLGGGNRGDVIGRELIAALATVRRDADAGIGTERDAGPRRRARAGRNAGGGEWATKHPTTAGQPPGGASHAASHCCRTDWTAVPSLTIW